jgi:subtilase family serine protease
VFGAGGGTSTLFAQPWYQHGKVPAALANRSGQAMRVSPDVAAVGDPYTGFYYGQTVGGVFGIDTIGGTSLSCPLFAGIQALASQHRRVAIGFASPLLYALGDDVFRDVTPHSPIHYASVSGGYLGTFDQDSSLATREGYDNVTGLGTPKGAALLRAEGDRH